MDQRTCSILDCDAVHLARGYCGPHYHEARKQGLDPLPRVKLCTVDGCDAKHHGKGLCRRHRERELRTGDPEGSSRRRTVGCKIDGCVREHSGLGYCSRHYQQHRAGGTVGGARDLEKLPAPIPCRTCGAGHDGESGLMAFCTRSCYYRWHRSGGDFQSLKSCVDCGEEFSLLQVGEGGRATRRTASRCEECREEPWGGWCMTTWEIARRDGGWFCAIGGEPIDRNLRFPDPGAPTVDHFIPRSRGGADMPENVQLACWEHNRQKSDKMPTLA